MSKATKEKNEPKGENLPAVPEKHPLALMNMAVDEVQDLIETNLGGEALSVEALGLIKTPSGEGLAFTVETLDGSAPVTVLTGIIVGRRRVRSFYKTEYGAGEKGARPDCASEDCVTGEGLPGGICHSCPYNKFDSAEKGRGKACRENLLLFIVPPDAILPTVLRVPPSSLRPARLSGSSNCRQAGARRP